MLILIHRLCAILVAVFSAFGGIAKGQSTNCIIESYSWNGYNGVINEDFGEYGVIEVFVPFGTNLTSIFPTLTTVSDFATVSPASGDEIDASNAGDGETPILYTVTAEDQVTTREYDVYFIEGFPESKMLSMSFGGTPATIGPVTNGISFVTITLPNTTDLTTLAPTYTLSIGATCEISSGSTQDFTHAVEYTVYSGGGGYESTTYVVMVTVDNPIPVGASGSGTLRFTKIPSASSWATTSIAGAEQDITTDAGLDSAMSNIVASSISNPLSIYQNLALSTAYWRYDLFKIGTEPVGNKMTLLKSTLKNTSGGTLGGLAVSYELGATNTPAEEIKGHRVYWSLTGAAGSWTAAGTHLQTSMGVSTVNFDIEFTSGWANDANLYIVWADDNGTGTQGIFTIDQVSFTPIPPSANILTFGVPGYPGTISGNEITITLPFDTNLTALTPTYTLSYGATCDKASGSAQNFTQPVQYTVTSAGSTISKVYTVFIQPTNYWTHSAWTNDATSGILSGEIYTAAANLGSTSAPNINGVQFEGINGVSGTNFTIGGTISSNTDQDGANNITGSSATLGQNYIFNGVPRTVTLTNLIPGAVYETTFFSVGSSSPRPQDFSSGGIVLSLDPSSFGVNNGRKIIHRFVADASTRLFTIAPTSNGSFLMYALANRQMENAAATSTTTTQLASSLNPSNPTAAPSGVTFTATLKNGNNTATAATGNYAFRRNGVLLGVAPINNGVASFTTTALQPGSQTITAKYLSDATYRASEASLIQVDNTPITLTVNSGTGSGTYLGTDTITITANAPPAGKTFDGWVINSGTATISDPESAYTTLTLKSVNVTITATYGTASLGGITPRAWYDANDATTITQNAGKVSEWRDRSGNNRHVAQATDVRRPIISNSTIAFDGIDDLLTRSGAFMYAAGSVDVYVVGAMANTKNRSLIAECRSNNDNPWYSIAHSSNNQAGAMGAFVRDDGTTQRFTNNNLLSANTALSRTETKIYLWKDTGSLMSGRVNGGAPTSQAYTRTGTLTLNSFSIGAIGPRQSPPNGIYHMDAGINEIIITPNLSDADRQKIEGYLAWKWDGIRGNNLLVSALPANHLYKSAPPASNTAPVAIAQNVAVTYATAKSITLTGYDAEANPLTYSTVTGPSHGTLSGTAPNLTYTPAFGYSGSDSFTFRVNDGQVDSTSATVSITVADGDRFAQWETLNNYNIGGSTDDDDGDGLNNFNEFAFGLNPTSGASSNPIVVPLDKATHTFTYTRYAYSNLTYTVWTSTDLQNWGVNPVSVSEVVSEPNASGVVTVQTTLTSPPVNAAKLFMRVKAE